MAADNSDPAILNLSQDEKQAFSFLFKRADKDQLGVVTGENAVSFFERTKVPQNVLGQIWQIADTENRGLLTKPGFSIVLRLIGHYQSGREPSNELAFKQAPVPVFEGQPIPGVGGPAGSGIIPSPTAASFAPNVLQPQNSGQAPIRVPPLDPAKVQQYSGLFERSGARNGMIDGVTAKSIFEKAGLPNEVLGRIWGLADREQRGALDQTEFIVAMHLLTSMKSRAMVALPNTLPPGLYEAAARRGAPPPSRQGTGNVAAAIPRQLTGSSIGAIPRTQSPLARPAGFGTPPPAAAPWLVTPADKAKFDQFFNSIDTQGRGIVGGEQAVAFFSDSRLPEDTLAQIWDLADINSEGHLNKEQFAVAMYLIRQQRAPDAPILPAFLPVQLVPPSMRNKPQQPISTAPVFDNANNTSNLPKSAADDLFGLDQPASPTRISSFPAPLQPQSTGASASRDPFAASQPGSPASPQRFQAPIPQASSMFKPFTPTSAFGASLAQQNTGGSAAPIPPPPAPRAAPVAQSSGFDDLLGDNDTSADESSRLTAETTELANMSGQIGNLRNQMEQTQTKKTSSQAELNAVAAQKKDLEARLQQFRAQYEQEVQSVKTLEQQLSSSRESTKKLNQELALLEGTYQDLQTQRQTIAQALQADQQENANLKQRLAELNAEVTRLKPELEKLKLDARQQKGMASINKKQLSTVEGERDRLQAEKATLESEAAAREAENARATAFPDPEPVPAPPSAVASPASTLSATNPFFRKQTSEAVTDRGTSTPPRSGHNPTPSAFDALFGPSSHSRSGTPPVTSFGSRGPVAGATGMSDSIQSFSSVGEHTPSETPPVSDGVKDSPIAASEPPPPPVSTQFTSSQLPVRELSRSRDTETSSTFPVPPASRAGELDARSEAFSGATTPLPHVPGSFDEAAAGISPAVGASKDDFDSAFASFGDAEVSKDETAPAVTQSSSATTANHSRGFSTEFPPIRSLEHEDDDDDSEDDESEDGQHHIAPTQHAPATESLVAPAATTTSEVSVAGEPPALEAQSSPPPYEDTGKPVHGGQGERAETLQFPNEFDGLLPSREDSDTLGLSPADEPLQQSSVPTARGATAGDETPPAIVQPSRVSTAANDIFHDAVSRPTSTVHDAQPVAAKDDFDDFDEFDNLAPAQEAGKSNMNELDFGFGGQARDDFDAAFDSPAPSMSTTIASTQNTPAPSSLAFTQEPSFSTARSTTFDSNSSIQHTPQTATGQQHDWDAIFSGLDSSKAPDTSFSADPWNTTNGSTSSTTAATTTKVSSAAPKPPVGGALTPGTEHDDPFLKRLTGMGYPRADALNALETCDYDINRAIDRLSSR